MTPANIIGMAALKGLEAVAITDHNSSLNCRAAMKLGEENGILVIPGMELTTEEEAHVLCLFYTLEEALAFSEHVYSCLQPVKNNPTVFGHQYICDEDENITGEIENLLINLCHINHQALFVHSVRNNQVSLKFSLLPNIQHQKNQALILHGIL